MYFSGIGNFFGAQLNKVSAQYKKKKNKESKKKL